MKSLSTATHENTAATLPLPLTQSAGLKRRLIHITAGSFFPVLLIFFPRIPVLSASLAIFGIAAAVEIARLRSPEVNRWVIRRVGSLMKPVEHSRPLGVTYWLASSPLVIGVMPQPVAVLVLMYLAVGDSVAPVVGLRYGRHHIFGKTLEGSAAFLASCLTVGGLLLATGLETSLPVMFVGAVAATVVELVPGPMNDNVRVPLATGGLIVLVSHFWGW
jgi:dolichol kinase